MSQRSSIFTTLPIKVRRQLDRRLIRNGFSGYAALTAWLNSLGYPISKSALNRYGVELQHRERELALAGAREQVDAFADLGAKDNATTVRGLLRMVEAQIFLMLANAGEKFDISDLTRLAKSVIDLVRVQSTLESLNADLVSFSSLQPHTSPESHPDDGRDDSATGAETPEQKVDDSATDAPNRGQKSADSSADAQTRQQKIRNVLLELVLPCSPAPPD
jgi:hypothetical protein